MHAAMHGCTVLMRCAAKYTDGGTGNLYCFEGDTDESASQGGAQFVEAKWV